MVRLKYIACLAMTLMLALSSPAFCQTLTPIPDPVGDAGPPPSGTNECDQLAEWIADLQAAIADQEDVVKAASDRLDGATAVLVAEYEAVPRNNVSLMAAQTYYLLRLMQYNRARRP